MLPNFGTLKSVPHLGDAQAHFLEGWLEQPRHRLAHLVGDVVDDGMLADVDALALGDVLRVAIGPHVEADDDGVRRRREQHVGLVDRADARVNDSNLDLLVRELGQRVGEDLGRALHVRLDDDRQLFHAAFGDLRLQRLERQAGALGAERTILRLLLAERRDLTRARRIGDLEDVARLRQAGETQHLHRSRRTGRLGGPAAIVDQRTDTADDRSGDERIADVQGSVLDQHGRDRAAALVELRLEDRAGGMPLRIRLELADVAHQQHHLEQKIEVLLLLRRHFHRDRSAAPLFRHQVELRQLALDPLGVRIRLVDLVDRDDDRHRRGARVIDRLARLRHHAIVGRDHQNDDVGHLGAACPHQREGLVAGRVEKHDIPAVDRHMVGADVLGNAARLALGHTRLADRIEQARLAVIDVTHDGHDRRA